LSYELPVPVSLFTLSSALMKTSAISLDEFASSVLAVPPLARHADLSINAAANQKLISHIEGGGITTLLYGGNANIYHLPLREYAPLLEMLAAAAGPQTRVIPAIGPDFGKMIEQAQILKGTGYRTAMVLPMQGFTTPEGVADGIERFVEAAGMPITLYIKSEQYIDLDRLQRLVESQHVLCVKYAVVRTDPGQDPYLKEMIERISTARIVSGMGERPVLSHVGVWGLTSFTTGSGCLAPRACMDLLRALKAGDGARAQVLYNAFMPLETLRDNVSLIRVLHDAVSWSGLADMGAHLPLLCSTPDAMHAPVEAAARALLAFEASR
jgi:dihydrodipicolinate synthase/N-acetylneuraminate lyase